MFLHCACARQSTYIHTQELFRVSNQIHMHIFGLWKESRLREDPHRHGENMFSSLKEAFPGIKIRRNQNKVQEELGHHMMLALISLFVVQNNCKIW